MFISVVLPAPFSPISPWIDPREADRETPRLAWTEPKRLSIPRSSSANPGGPPGAWVAGLSGSTALRGLVLGDADPASDYLGPGLVKAPLHFRGYQFPVEFVERIIHPALREAEHLRASLPCSAPRVVENGLHRHVDALDRRGEHASRMEVVLVAVAADAEKPGIGGGLHDADAGGACRVEHHVRAAPELALCQLGAHGGVRPSRGRCAGHVLDDLGLWVHVRHSRAVTERELAYEGNVHPAHEPDLPGLRRHRGRHAAQKRGLLLPEVDRLDVRQVDHSVDDRELHIWKLPGDRLNRRRLGESNRDDDAGAAPGELPHDLLALRCVLDLEVADGDSRLLFESLRPLARGLVERAVELAAE